MLNISVEIKNLLKTNTATKNFRVTFPNGERADIINDNIVFESVRFTESAMSQDKFKLGLCESPVIEFEAFGIENIKGKKIECYYEIYCDSTVDDAVYREDLDAYVYPIPLGVFYVDSCQKEAKMNMRKVIAYGMQAYFEWKIPEGTFYKFYTSTDTIDISTYLALVTQSLATVDVTSIVDIAEGEVRTRESTNLYVYYENSATPPAQQHILSNDSMYRLINPMSIFVDFVGTLPSETSMTWEIDRIRVRMIRLHNLLRSQRLSSTGSLFTFNTVSKVPNPKSAQNAIVEMFNEYIQDYECRVGSRAIDIVSHIDYIKDRNSNTAFYTQHFAFASYGDAEDVLQDIKYVLAEDISIPSYIYVWNNNKTEYERYSSSSDRYLTDVIANLERGSDTSQAYSQAIANLKSVWEAVTGRTWGNGYVYDSGWANGEGNVVTFGKRINRNRMSYSLGKNEYLTPQEAQSYAQSIIESYGKIGRVNREGNFEAFTIDTDTLVPNNTDLVPSESLVPNGADVDTINPSEYETAWYDDELSLPYGACAANHKVSGTDTFTIVYADGYDADTDPSTYQIYDISNNDLVKEMTVEEITPILTTIITNLSNLRYMPSDIDMVGRPDIEAGDGIQVMSNSGAFNTYVLSRTTDGIQGLSDTITAK